MTLGAALDWSSCVWGLSHESSRRQFQSGTHRVLQHADGMQRFFGVSRLKINPLASDATTNNAAASATLEQQVTQGLTLTYIQGLSRR